MIYARLEQLGYAQKKRLSWRRGIGEISQAHLPIYLDFFEFVHNAKKRGKALLSSLLELIIS